jgi:hypothetical protein
MSAPDNYRYYQERASAERKSAEIAPSEKIAAIHLELARQYEALVAEIKAGAPLKLVSTLEVPSKADPGEETLGGFLRKEA